MSLMHPTSGVGFQGILFPDRAESLRRSEYTGYRVFLDFWAPLSAQLRTFYENVVTRGDTRALLVFAPQGGGKTMFARKLATDFEATPAGTEVEPDHDNLWHRISGGTLGAGDRLAPELIRQSRQSTTVVNISNDVSLPGQRIGADRNWLTTLRERVASDLSRRWVVILDNAEQGHFLQALVNLTDAEYVTHARDPETTALAAQRFVVSARQELRGCLFLLLTNDDAFAAGLEAGVNSQHQGLLARADLPLPGPQEKETVVRVNTNRLNSISYWYCLDRAGPTEKAAVFRALSGAATFPDSFHAVDTAIRTAQRLGRRARQNLLSLVVLTNEERGFAGTVQQLGNVWREEVNHQWMYSATLDEHWAARAGLSARDASFLESEWVLRVVALGAPFTAALMSQDAALVARCKDLLEQLKAPEGSSPGTRETTRDQIAQGFRDAVNGWPDVSGVDTTAFWSMGQRRSVHYEVVLSNILPGYNTAGNGFLQYRPDLIISPFHPCSILSARSEDISDINAAIYRDAHVFEFTALSELTVSSVQTYLGQKLPNYVSTTREQ